MARTKIKTLTWLPKSRPDKVLKFSVLAFLLLGVLTPDCLNAQRRRTPKPQSVERQVQGAERSVIQLIPQVKSSEQRQKLRPEDKHAKSLFEKRKAELNKKLELINVMAKQQQVPEAWLALANIELARQEHLPDEFDIEKAKSYMERFLELKPDSVTGRLTFANVLEIDQQMDQRLEQLKTAYELDVHSFEPYANAISDAQKKNDLLDEVNKKIEQLVSGDSFDVNTSAKVIETVQKISNLRSDNVANELRLFKVLESEMAMAGFYPKQALERLENSLGRTQSHFYYLKGDIEKQLQILNEIVIQNATEKNKSRPNSTPQKPALGKQVMHDLLEVVLKHPEYAARARAIYDPFERNFYRPDTEASRIMADHLAELGKDPELERWFRIQAYEYANREDAISLMKSHLDAGQDEIWRVVRAIEKNRKSIYPRLDIWPKEDNETRNRRGGVGRNNWGTSDAVDAFPGPKKSRSQPAVKVNPELEAEFYYLRGRLAMRLERFGTAVHYLKKAVAMTDHLSKQQQTDAQTYLDESTKKILDENWAGPSKIYPKSSSGPVSHMNLKKRLFAALNLEQIEPQKKYVRKPPTELEKAELVIRDTNRQTKQFREAIEMLEQAASSDHPNKEKICLALARCEMNKFGNRYDKNFDAEYVFKYLDLCREEGPPPSTSYYSTRCWALERLERPQEYRKNYQELYNQYPSTVWQLYRANIIVNRADENPALMEKECDRLKQLLESDKSVAGTLDFQNALNSLARKTHDPKAVLEIYETVKKNTRSFLHRNLKSTYEELKTKDENQEFEKSELWTKLEEAFHEDDEGTFGSLLRDATRRAMPMYMSSDELMDFFDRANQHGLTQSHSKHVARILIRYKGEIKRFYTALYWCERRSEELRLEKMIGKYLMDAGDFDAALKHFQSATELVSEDEEALKLLEKCKRKLTPEKPR